MFQLTPLRAPKSSYLGVTLIEFMIGIAIGLIVTLALMAVFLNVSRSSAELIRVNQQVENGRAALQILEQEVVHVGYWGSFVPDYDNLTLGSIPGDTPTALPDICTPFPWTAAQMRNIAGIPAQSLDAPPASCTTLMANRQANTDILSLVHAETCLPGVGNCAAEVTNALYVEMPMCGSAGISNSLAMSTMTLPLTLTGTTPDWRSSTTADGLETRVDCSRAVNKKRKLVAAVYFVRSFANGSGDGLPTLMRSRMEGTSTIAFQPPEALVEGIEGFRVEWGIDSLSEAGSAVDYGTAVDWTDATRTVNRNRGDGVADGDFVRCTTAVPCTVAQMTNAVAARIWVLARAPEPTPGYTDAKTYSLGSSTMGPFNDAFKRHVYSSVVTLRNVSDRRQTP
ncbi:MAG TPA: PilW family protein [Burkholderiaceae bacterium]|nr:PilW family protein [Burkholderiaceae bacterium]